MIRFNIEPQLKAEWEPILDKQLHLILTPVLANIKFAYVNFYLQSSSSRKNLKCFCCEFQGYGGAQKETYHAFAENIDGKTAIRDSLSRIRRTIIRKYQHTMLTTNVVSISAKQPRINAASEL